MIKLRVVIASVFVLFLAGCASVTGTKNQPVSIQATCEGEAVDGAACELKNDKGTWFLKTPNSVVVTKSFGDLSVTCKLGEASQSTTFQSKSNGGVWGNILVGGIIGYAVDANTGAGFDYPPNMTVSLGEGCKKTLSSSQSNTNDLESKLNNLQKLLDRGLITNQEFFERRKLILQNM